MASARLRGLLLPAVSVVEGLGVSPGEAPWLGRPLAIRQERAFRLAGVEPGPDDPEADRVVLAADAVATPATVLGILRQGRARGTPTSFVPGGELGVLAAALWLGREGVLAAFVPAGVPMDPEALAALEPDPLDPGEQSLDVPVPASTFGAAKLTVPLADRILLPAGHWVQVLWANLLGLGPFLWKEFLGANAAVMVWRIARAALRARSVEPARLSAIMGRRGRGTHVHPSAVVEGSWLGEGVEVGAQAVVRGAILAAGARVEDLALVEYAVVGPAAVVHRQAQVTFSVLDARAACAGAVRLGLLGTGAAIREGATLMDTSALDRIPVEAAGTRHPAPLGLAGACVGPRSVVRGGVRIPPGAVVPADTIL
ncbi:MAG: hypothetical protein JXB39_10205 [Deltaproteobacteria bacterium]|nr:hypothetical protein [Deltaproteobacteria bacterium]